MARKKTTEAETPQAAGAMETADQPKSKMGKAEALCAEWTQAGKSIESDDELVAELAKRYPDAGITKGDVGNGKRRFLNQSGKTTTRKRTAATAKDEPVTIQETAEVRDWITEEGTTVADVLEQISAVRTLAAKFGGLDRLGQSLDFLKSVGVE